MELGIVIAGLILIGLMIYHHDNNVDEAFSYLEEVITNKIDH